MEPTHPGNGGNGGNVVVAAITSPLDTTPIVINGVTQNIQQPILPQSVASGRGVQGHITQVRLPSASSSTVASPSRGAVSTVNSGVTSSGSVRSLNSGRAPSTVTSSDGVINPAPPTFVISGNRPSAARTVTSAAGVVTQDTVSPPTRISGGRSAPAIQPGGVMSNRRVGGVNSSVDIRMVPPGTTATARIPPSIVSPSANFQQRQNFVPQEVPLRSTLEDIASAETPRRQSGGIPHRRSNTQRANNFRSENFNQGIPEEEDIYDLLTEEELEERRLLITNHYNKMRNDFPDKRIPPINPDWDLRTLERRYNMYCKSITSSIFGQLTTIGLVIYFAAVEIFLTNFLGLRASGYTNSQIKFLSRYSFLIDRIGGFGVSLLDDNSSPILQIFFLSLVNAVILMGANYLSKMMGNDGTVMAESLMALFAGLMVKPDGKVGPPPDGSFNILDELDMGSIATKIKGVFSFFSGGAANNGAAQPAAAAAAAPVGADDFLDA